MPSTQSYMAQLVADAGADYIYKENNSNSFCIQLPRCVDPLLFINNIPYSLIRWIAVITLSVNSACYDITGKNYSATHCLLLFAIKAGDLLDSVKKASINCSKQTIEAFSFDIIAVSYTHLLLINMHYLRGLL